MQITHSIRYDLTDMTVELWGTFFVILHGKVVKIGEPFLQRWRYMTPLEEDLNS